MKSLLCSQINPAAMAMIHRRLHSCPNLLPHHWEQDEKPESSLTTSSFPPTAARASWNFITGKGPHWNSQPTGSEGKLQRPREQQSHTHVHTHTNAQLSKGCHRQSTLALWLFNFPKKHIHTHHILKRVIPNHQHKHKTLLQNRRALPPTEKTTLTHTGDAR